MRKPIAQAKKGKDMADVTDELQTALEAIQAAQEALNANEPTLADQVLEAVVPVLEAAGYTAPAPTEATDDTPPANQ